MNPLFRSTAVQAQHVKWHGAIVLARPVSLLAISALAVAFAVLAGAFLLFGSYTMRSTVSGQLVPDTGLVKVYVPQPGIILAKYVKEGQLVRRGELLYLLSSERQGGNQGEIQASISGQVAARRQSLLDELRQTGTLQQEDRGALEQKVAGLATERAQLAQQLDGQKNRITLAENATQRGTIARARLRFKGNDATEAGRLARSTKPPAGARARPVRSRTGMAKSAQRIGQPAAAAEKSARADGARSLQRRAGMDRERGQAPPRHQRARGRGRHRRRR